MNILSLRYPKTKLILLTLLSINIIAYALLDTLISALDALAWVGLLILYELEADENLANISKNTQETCRNSLIALVVLVFFGYVYQQEWLEVINALLWFTLIALLELEIRFPERVAVRQNQFKMINACVFICLTAMVPAWLIQSSWLDAYDACLWIVAFAMIEVDIFHVLPLRRS
ncbi:hypothetical protein [Methylomonas sp. AM2-LC]|uniref:hypothetical protein n=1 Tax=Methylomonas sp. AM2-LC TaxID=3153301 RepID=UPI003267FA92